MRLEELFNVLDKSMYLEVIDKTNHEDRDCCNEFDRQRLIEEMPTAKVVSVEFVKELNDVILVFVEL